MADEHATEERGYELSDIQLKLVLISGIGLVVMTVAAYIISTFFIKYLNTRDPNTDFVAPPLAAEGQEWTSGVRLQPDPFGALDEFLEDQALVSTQYGRLSDEPEIYRIPVETALKIVAEGGLPVFEPLPTKDE